MNTNQLYTREAPFLAELLQRHAQGHTFSLSLSVDPDMGYVPGDSVAILPENDPARLDQIIDLLGVGSSSLFESKAIQHVTGKFLRFARPFAKRPSEIDALIEQGRITDYFVPLWEVLEACEGVPLDGCLENLSPLLPRYYSIASAKSQSVVDLLIARTQMPTWRGENLLGLCTDYLCNRAEVNSSKIQLYLHRAEHFRLPQDPYADIIMIGPGTGIAPFRAFLHARSELPGKNWLFFGARHKASDFYYEKELRELEALGKLKLTTAFSRDADQKIYVQDRLLEAADELWQWLQNGAHLYICGDAKRMARDVTAALNEIAAQRASVDFIKELKAAGRLALDVY